MPCKRILLILLSLSLLVTSCNNKEHVDLILRNAKIYTVNSNFAVMQSAAIRNGKFVAVSSDANINARYTADSVIELKGKFVYPGFIDTHAHFSQYALSLSHINLDTAKTIKNVIDQLSDFQRDNPDMWIVGKNLDAGIFYDKEMQICTILNNHFPETPVLIWLSDYNFALINKAFADKLPAEANIKSGIVNQRKAVTASKFIPAPNDSIMTELLKQAEHDCFNAGITSTTDFGATYNNVQLIDSLQKNGCLQIPVYAVLEPLGENVSKYISKMPYQTDNLKVQSIGVSLDGQLTQNLAVMRAPYGDNHNGQLVISADSLLQICKTAYEHGFQMCVNSIGDSATRLTLNTFAKILPIKNDMRWRIEGLHMTVRKDLRILNHYNIIPSIQPLQYQPSKAFIDNNFNRKLLREAFAWKHFLSQDRGIICGSDCPYNQLNPMAVFYASVKQEKRKMHNKQSQELSTTQALKAMTIWAAYSQFDDKQKGSIEVGKWADFIVTSENITTMYQPNLPNVTIERTYLRGKRVK